MCLEYFPLGCYTRGRAISKSVGVKLGWARDRGGGLLGCWGLDRVVRAGLGLVLVFVGRMWERLGRTTLEEQISAFNINLPLGELFVAVP